MYLFNIFGSLAQYERALTREQIRAGLDAAKKRGRRGGRPKIINDEKIDAIVDILKAGNSESSVCRTFNIKRSTLYNALDRYKIRE